MYLQSLSDVLRELLEIPPVVLGEDQFPDAHPARNDHLFSDTPTGEDPPDKRQLPSHGDLPYTAVVCQGQQGRGHVYARAGPVLGGGARGHVQVYETLLEKSRICTERLGVADQVGVPMRLV
jgi:hypothetical protein